MSWICSLFAGITNPNVAIGNLVHLNAPSRSLVSIPDHLEQHEPTRNGYPTFFTKQIRSALYTYVNWPSYLAAFWPRPRQGKESFAQSLVGPRSVQECKRVLERVVSLLFAVIAWLCAPVVWDITSGCGSLDSTLFSLGTAPDPSLRPLTRQDMVQNVLVAVCGEDRRRDCSVRSACVHNGPFSFFDVHKSFQLIHFE